VRRLGVRVTRKLDLSNSADVPHWTSSTARLTKRLASPALVGQDKARSEPSERTIDRHLLRRAR
jgi:hypothetical protein